MHFDIYENVLLFRGFMNLWNSHLDLEGFCFKYHRSFLLHFHLCCTHVEIMVRAHCHGLLIVLDMSGWLYVVVIWVFNQNERTIDGKCCVDTWSSMIYQVILSVCDNSQIMLSSVSDYVHDKFSRTTVKYTFLEAKVMSHNLYIKMNSFPLRNRLTESNCAFFIICNLMKKAIG